MFRRTGRFTAGKYVFIVKRSTLQETRGSSITLPSAGKELSFCSRKLMMDCLSFFTSSTFSARRVKKNPGRGARGRGAGGRGGGGS